ncbi:MAG: hypothetical protein BWX48_02510 [Verrucomicrobia bacterium ADurb.Bin006]|jgi:hypothetical protein|nr:MAG: hypothetical protein BWX48_02510 [Verrucomicrobia bacterium ADurb.Bin006]
MEETRAKLYRGAKRAMAAIGRCRPYRLHLPIKAKKEYLVFGGAATPSVCWTSNAVVAG